MAPPEGASRAGSSGPGFEAISILVIGLAAVLALIAVDYLLGP